MSDLRVTFFCNIILYHRDLVRSFPGSAETAPRALYWRYVMCFKHCPVNVLVISPGVMTWCVRKSYTDAFPQKRHCVFDELPRVGFVQMSLPFFGGSVQCPAEHDCNAPQFPVMSPILIEQHIIYYDLNLISSYPLWHLLDSDSWKSVTAWKMSAIVLLSTMLSS